MPPRQRRPLKERLGNLVALTVTIGALGAVAWRVTEAVTTPPDPYAPRTVKNWRGYASAGNRLGPANAPVTIVEFADYQCPFCARAVPDLDSLLETYGGRLAVVYRHFPIVDIHPDARDAAEAVQCAAEQDAFWDLHRLLFAKQGEIGERSWLDFAADAGVSDLNLFQECLSTGRPAATLTRDSLAAAELAIAGTPTFLINDVLIPGHPGFEKLDSMVKHFLSTAAP